MRKILFVILFSLISLILFNSVKYTGDFNTTFFDNAVFDTTDERIISGSYPIYGKTIFGLFVDVDATNDTTDMTLNLTVEVSDDDTTFYSYDQNYLTSMVYSTVDAKEYYLDKILANYIRINGLSANCTTGNFYTTTVKGYFR